VDISLAVDMMHYATIEDGYDVGVLVTGDKDFMPAMSRVRQKGKRMVLTTMRNSCNRDLLDRSTHGRTSPSPQPITSPPLLAAPHLGGIGYPDSAPALRRETPTRPTSVARLQALTTRAATVYDFDPIFIDDSPFLDRLIMPRPPGQMPFGRSSPVEVDEEAQFALQEIVVECLEKREGVQTLRDVGRYLQASKVGDANALEMVKDLYMNLRSFIRQVGPEVMQVRGANLHLVTNGVLAEGRIGRDEGRYGVGGGFSRGGGDGRMRQDEGVSKISTYVHPSVVGDLKLAQLKELLKEHGRPVSGNKAELVARLLEAMESAPPGSKFPPFPFYSASPFGHPLAQCDPGAWLARLNRPWPLRDAQVGPTGTSVTIIVRQPRSAGSRPQERVSWAAWHCCPNRHASW
jgi:hypothetical protein